MRAETARIYALSREKSERRPGWLKACMLVLLFIVLTAPRVLAQPAPETPLPMPTLHMRLGTGEGTLRGPNGKDYVIPQGSRILAPEAWSTLDAEMVRLQEQETRLAAENKSLRQSASAFSPGVVVIVTALAVGLAGGAYLGHKYLD